MHIQLMKRTQNVIELIAVDLTEEYKMVLNCDEYAIVSNYCFNH